MSYCKHHCLFFDSLVYNNCSVTNIPHVCIPMFSRQTKQSEMNFANLNVCTMYNNVCTEITSWQQLTLLRNYLPYNNLRLWNQLYSKISESLVAKQMGCWLSYMYFLEFQWILQSMGSKCVLGNSSHSKWYKLSKTSLQFIYFSFLGLACFTIV